jgi:hypothetical protein
VLFGVVLVGAGARGVRRLRWTRGVLADNPWVAVASRVFEIAGSDSSTRPVLRVVELSGAPDEGAVFAGPVSGRLMEDLAPVAWVAGSDRHFLVAAPGGAPVMRLKRIRIRGTRAFISERRPAPAHDSSGRGPVDHDGHG